MHKMKANFSKTSQCSLGSQFLQVATTSKFVASLLSSTKPLPPEFNRGQALAIKPTTLRAQRTPHPEPTSANSNTKLTVVTERKAAGLKRLKDKDAKDRKVETNKKIASRKAISVVLMREATKSHIEKKKGSKRLLPRIVLKALHERITALGWESALKVFQLLQEQLWYRPNPGVYIKLIVMLGKCKQPEKAELFQVMIDDGCGVSHESYTALISAYGRSSLFDKAFSLLEQMKDTPDCQPDVHIQSS